MKTTLFTAVYIRLLKSKQGAGQTGKQLNKYVLYEFKNILICGWNNVKTKVLKVNGFSYIDVVMVHMHK